MRRWFPITSRRHAGRIAADVLLVAAGTAVALVASELLVRRLVPQHLPLGVALRNLHRPDDALGYVMVPNFHRRVRTPEFTCDLRTNSLGLRDRELEPSVTGRLRLLAIGDSFTLGIHAGAEDSCFVERLESHLDHELHQHPTQSAAGSIRGVEVINAGVDGYGTLQEIGLLERLGPRLQPAAVLLAFYLGNDFTDNSGRTRMTVVDGYQMLEASAAPYREHFRPLQRRLRLWLHAHSQLYLLAKSRLVHPLRRALPADAARVATPRAFDYYLYDAGFAAAATATPTPDLERSLAATAEALRTLRAWCDAHAARALVVAIPAEQQVSAPARLRWEERFGLEDRRLDLTLPNRRLAALAAQAGLPFVDLTVGFAARVEAGADFYLHDDNHWNAAGHAVAAQLLAEPCLELLVETPPAMIGTR